MGLYRDYRVYVRVILGLFWDNGKENGNYYKIIGYIGTHWGNIGVILG